MVAGGAAKRWGGRDKLAAEIDGRTVLDWTVAGLAQGGAGRVICVGPTRQPAAGSSVTWVVEDPPGAGPLAAVAAGVAEVRSDYCWVCAGDQPLFFGAMPVLGEALAASAGAGAAVAVLRVDARRQPLAALWRTGALVARAAASRPDAAVNALFDGVQVIEVPDTGQWSLDCDKPDQLAELATALRRTKPG